jgi:hypothetical protein
VACPRVHRLSGRLQFLFLFSALNEVANKNEESIDNRQKIRTRPRRSRCVKMARRRRAAHTVALTRLAQGRPHRAHRALRYSNGLIALRKRGSKNALQVRSAIGVAKKIKGSQVQRC